MHGDLSVQLWMFEWHQCIETIWSLKQTKKQTKKEDKAKKQYDQNFQETKIFSSFAKTEVTFQWTVIYTMAHPPHFSIACRIGSQEKSDW